jgi:hypothetical protein
MAKVIEWEFGVGYHKDHKLHPVQAIQEQDVDRVVAEGRRRESRAV